MNALRKRLTTSLVLLAVAALTPLSISAAELHLIFNVNHDQDLYPRDAGKTLQEALDGVKPAAIDASAGGYFVQLDEGSSPESLSLKVKGEKAAAGSATAAAMSDSAGEAAMSGSEDEGESSKIDFTAR